MAIRAFRFLRVTVGLVLTCMASRAVPAQLQALATVKVSTEAEIILARPRHEEFLIIHSDRAEPQDGFVLGVSSKNAAELYRFVVPHTIEAAAASNNGDRLFVIGVGHGKGYATRIDLDAAPANNASPSTVELPEVPNSPSAAVDATGRLLVGDIGSGAIIAINPNAFGGAQERPLSPDFYSELPVTGAGPQSLAVAINAPIGFFSAGSVIFTMDVSGDPRISGFYEYSRFGKLGRLDNDVSSLELALSSSHLGGSLNNISIAVGDRRGGTLSILDYNSAFNTLDLITTITVPLFLHSTPGPESQMSSRSVQKASMLLASDEAQDVILAGSVLSGKLIQYSRGSSSLEQIGSISVDGLPSAIAVGGDGHSGMVGLSGRAGVVVLGEVSQAGNDDPVTSKIKELQRALTQLGFDVGAVDGVRGPSTERAIAIFKKFSKSRFPESDVDAALSAVQDFSRKCSINGLICLAK